MVLDGDTGWKWGCLGSHDVSRYGQGQDAPCGANAGLERVLGSAA